MRSRRWTCRRPRTRTSSSTKMALQFPRDVGERSRRRQWSTQRKTRRHEFLFFLSSPKFRFFSIWFVKLIDAALRRVASNIERRLTRIQERTKAYETVNSRAAAHPQHANVRNRCAKRNVFFSKHSIPNRFISVLFSFFYCSFFLSDRFWYPLT